MKTVELGATWNADTANDLSEGKRSDAPPETRTFPIDDFHFPQKHRPCASAL